MNIYKIYTKYIQNSNIEKVNNKEKKERELENKSVRLK